MNRIDMLRTLSIPNQFQKYIGNILKKQMFKLGSPMNPGLTQNDINNGLDIPIIEKNIKTILSLIFKPMTNFFINQTAYPILSYEWKNISQNLQNRSHLPQIPPANIIRTLNHSWILSQEVNKINNRQYPVYTIEVLLNLSNKDLEKVNLFDRAVNSCHDRKEKIKRITSQLGIFQNYQYKRKPKKISPKTRKNIRIPSSPPPPYSRGGRKSNKKKRKSNKKRKIHKRKTHKRKKKI